MLGIRHPRSCVAASGEYACTSDQVAGLPQLSYLYILLLSAAVRVSSAVEIPHLI